jgi:hypothetical protein
MRILRVCATATLICRMGASCCCTTLRSLLTSVFSSDYLVTDFDGFLAWRDWDFPDRSIRNCFGMGATPSFILPGQNLTEARSGLWSVPSLAKLYQSTGRAAADTMLVQSGVQTLY